MRIVTTNDFVGSFFPQATSYGRLPGAAALQATVDGLRTEAGGGLWIDTGDLAQGSALGALSDGAWPFLALRELTVDVAVAGNHELDWGAEHLRRWGAELPFPLLAANLPVGLPATRMLPGGVGVIGLSLPGMDELHPGLAADPDPAGAAVALAAELRAAGAVRVVLALHDGVDPAPGRRRHPPDGGAVRRPAGRRRPRARRPHAALLRGPARRRPLPAAVGVRQPGRRGRPARRRAGRAEAGRSRSGAAVGRARGRRPGRARGRGGRAPRRAARAGGGAHDGAGRRDRRRRAARRRPPRPRRRRGGRPVEPAGARRRRRPPRRRRGHARAGPPPHPVLRRPQRLGRAAGRRGGARRRRRRARRPSRPPRSIASTGARTTGARSTSRSATGCWRRWRDEPQPAHGRADRRRCRSATR